MACHPEYSHQLFLAKVEYYCKLSFRSAEHLHTEWIAFVTFYDEHPCKVWFGGQTQVWARSISPLVYVRISALQNRVAYCEDTVDFGSRLGEQTVMIVSVLSN